MCAQTAQMVVVIGTTRTNHGFLTSKLHGRYFTEIFHAPDLLAKDYTENLFDIPRLEIFQ